MSKEREIKDRIIYLMKNEGLVPLDQTNLINALAIELTSKNNNKKTIQENNRLAMQKEYNFCSEFCKQHYDHYNVSPKFIISKENDSETINELILVTRFGVFKVFEKNIEKAKYIACKEAFKLFLS